MTKIVPENAKKVFEGVLFDTYQWEQEMYDGGKAIFEKVVRKASAGVILVKDNKIIILQQKQPDKQYYYPSLPGGRLDNNESTIEAAKRETLEELGYKVKNLKLLVESFGGSKVYFHDTIFIASSFKKISSPTLDGGEKIKIELWTFDEWLELCRNKQFAAPVELKFMMYEALLDKKKKETLKNKIFGIDNNH